MTESTTHVYSIYINAPAQQVWDAITTSDYTTKWGYGGKVHIDLTPGGAYTNFTTDEMKQMGLGDVSISGTVIEVAAPTRLVLDWKAGWYPDREPTRVTWELTEYPSGLTQVTLTHDVSNVPELGAEIAGGAGDPDQGGGGWPWALSGLKTLLETGAPMERPAS